MMKQIELYLNKIITKANFVALLHCAFTFMCERVMYSQGTYRAEFPTYFYVLGKTIVFTVIFIGWNMFFQCDFKERKTKTKLQIFLCYFIPLLVVLLLVWPGIWRWDEIITLGSVTSGAVYYWQHWLSALYQFMCMQLVPIPGGIVIVQCLLISLLVTNVLQKIRFTLNTKWVYLLYIPLFLPAVIDSNLYPIRANVSAYIELWLIFQLIFLCLFEEECSVKKILLMAILGGAMTAWRPENIIYIVGAPILLLALKRVSIKKCLIYVIISLLLVISSNSVQNKGLGQVVFVGTEQAVVMESEAYELSAIVTGLGELVKTDFKTNDKEADMELLERCFDMEMMRETGGLNVFWNGGIKSLSQEDLSDLKMLYIKLAIYNLPEFISSRWGMFVEGNFDMKSEILCKSSAHMFDEPYPENMPGDWVQMYAEFRERYFENTPYNIELRRNIVSLLEGKNLEDYNASSNIMSIILYNIFPSLILLCVIWVIEIRKKGLFFFLMIGIVLAKFAMVFLTAPTAGFMYYFSTYLIGLFVFVFWCLYKKFYKKSKL